MTRSSGLCHPSALGGQLDSQAICNNLHGVPIACQTRPSSVELLRVRQKITKRVAEVGANKCVLLNPARDALSFKEVAVLKMIAGADIGHDEDNASDCDSAR